jgi:hypothetical protein
LLPTSNQHQHALVSMEEETVSHSPS